MPSDTPKLPLVLLLLTSTCIAAGGVALSRREEQVRIPQEREPLRQFAVSLQKELLRLEEVHEEHVRSIANKVAMGDALRTQQECEAIAGVVGCSFLLRTAAREEHVRRPGVRAGAYAQPTFEAPSLGRSDIRLLERDTFTSSVGSGYGWLEDPGWPLTYWSQGPKSWVVFVTIEPQEVQVAISEWLQGWVEQRAEFWRLLDGHAGLVLPGGEVMTNPIAPVPDEPPHWSQPLVTRYGTWQLASWDRVESEVVYHIPSLVVTVLLSVLVAFLAIFIFASQRRAHRLAMQRVSFVNRVSHELRTPLTNMLLNLDIIEDSLPHEGRAASRLALVREEAGRLARLIANVLTFSKREQGALKLRPMACRPAQVVDAVLEQFSPSFARHGIIVTRDDTTGDTPCGLDPDALSQITANLLSNVEKYAPGAPVRILTAREGSHFILQVSDGGPGVASAEAERMFQPFVRLDDRVAAGATGTGLGLSIARDLAERMGGSLTLQPTGAGACKGASFLLRVPVADVAGQARSGPLPSALEESAPHETAPRR